MTVTSALAGAQYLVPTTPMQPTSLTSINRLVPDGIEFRGTGTKD